MALTPEFVRPVSPDPFIREEEDMMLIRLGHYKALVTAVATANAAAAQAQADADDALANAAAAARPYASYTAILNQSTTSAPVATILEDELYSPIVWARTGVGNYTAQLTGAFPANKTIVLATGLGVTLILGGRVSNNIVSLKTYNDSGVVADNLLQDTSIEIRVYN